MKQSWDSYVNTGKVDFELRAFCSRMPSGKSCLGRAKVSPWEGERKAIHQGLDKDPIQNSQMA